MFNTFLNNKQGKTVYFYFLVYKQRQSDFSSSDQKIIKFRLKHKLEIQEENLFLSLWFFVCPNEKKHVLLKANIGKITLSQNNWENSVLKVNPTEYCYIYTFYIYIYIYITRTGFEHHFSHLFRVKVVLSTWTFYEICFFCCDTRKTLNIQNLWTIPLITSIPYVQYITW